jgi:hypothetical protein
MSPATRKFIGAVVFSLVALTIAIIVITGSKYQQDDKKLAWSTLSLVGGFWLGTSTS